MAMLGYVTMATLAWSCLTLADEQVEKRLVSHLVQNYTSVGKGGRPAGNTMDPFVVEVNFGLIDLRKFDIQNQELIMVGWTSLEWKDTLLQWDPESFNGYESVAMDTSQIWTPDVVLTNSLSKPEKVHETYAHVTYEGQITWVSTYKYHFYCKIEQEKMEDEEFLCSLKFGSWSMTSETLKLVPKKDRFDAEYFVTNRDWEFLSNKARADEIQLPWGNRKWSKVVEYVFTVKKRQFFDDEELESAAQSPYVMTASMLTVFATFLVQLTDRIHV